MPGRPGQEAAAGHQAGRRPAQSPLHTGALYRLRAQSQQLTLSLARAYEHSEALPGPRWTQVSSKAARQPHPRSLQGHASAPSAACACAQPALDAAPRAAVGRTVAVDSSTSDCHTTASWFLNSASTIGSPFAYTVPLCSPPEMWHASSLSCARGAAEHVRCGGAPPYAHAWPAACARCRAEAAKPETGKTAAGRNPCYPRGLHAAELDPPEARAAATRCQPLARGSRRSACANWRAVLSTAAATARACRLRCQLVWPRAAWQPHRTVAARQVCT